MKDYEQFEGTIGRTQAESTPWWPTPRTPATTPPNVIVILLDDTGFAQFGCYGSDMSTPNIDRLAAGGLRYTNFHVTPLCSPTRAALLTGRNHHEVGMRSISNFSSGYPHMRGHISDHAATVAEVLRDEGYTTFARRQVAPVRDGERVGRGSRTTSGRASAASTASTGSWRARPTSSTPSSSTTTTWSIPPAGPEDGYHLTEDLRRPRHRVHPRHGVDPARSPVLHVPRVRRHARAAPGAAGVPREVPRPLRRGLGRGPRAVVRPPDRDGPHPRRHRARAPQPRRRGVGRPMPETHRRLAARLQEAFAAFLDHTDVQIGRLLDALERLGQLDNTMIVFLSDNGASQEGGPFGVDARDEVLQLHRRDARRGRRAHRRHRRPAQPHELPVGLGAGRQHAVQVVQAEHPRGRRPRAAHRALAAGSSPRAAASGDQFHHVNDIVPTIYEALGITPPDVYRGRRADADHRHADELHVR